MALFSFFVFQKVEMKKELNQMEKEKKAFLKEKENMEKMMQGKKALFLIGRMI